MKTKRIFVNFAVFVAYTMTAYFGLQLDAVGGFATTVWPPSGIALAAMLLFGTWVWPGIAVAAFAVNFLRGGPFLGDLGIAVGNTVEAFVITSFLARIGFQRSFARARDVLTFYGAVIAATALNGVIGSVFLLAGDIIPLSRFGYTWLVWWFGDMMGCLVVTPLLLAATEYRRKSVNALRLLENAIVGILLLTFNYLTFKTSPSELFGFPQPYLFFPLLAWAAVRFGQIGTTTAVSFVTAFAIWATATGSGPFTNATLTLGLLHLQSFILALSLTSHLLVAYVSELRTAERIVHRKKDELEKIVSERTRMLDDAQRIAKIGSWELDVLTDRVLWSTAHYEILELTPQDFDGTLEGFKKIVGDEARLKIDAAYRRSLETKQAQEFDYPFTKKSGKRIILHARGSSFLDDHGNLVRLVGTSQDVTEVRKIEEELRRAKLAAEQANEAKSNFLANMSHEIRTPLGIILGFSELLVDPMAPIEKRAEFVKAIKKNGAMLSDLISDILDLSKIEAGRLVLKKESVDLRELLEDVEMLMRGKAEEAGLDLRFQTFGLLPTKIETDPRLLKQVFVNIVGNAIKFTPRGRVEVRTSMMTTLNGEKKLAFDIIDTGIGMTTETCARLFKRFAQADDTMTRKFGGTGLGLILSQRFVRCLGGDLRIRASAPGHGTTFRITVDPGPLEKREFALDLGKSRAPERPSPLGEVHAHDLEGKSVLVVDDSVDNQNLVRHFLAAAGARVSTASNGKEGLERALSGDFDLVVMDIQMPVLDGVRATVALRRQGYSKPIIALTAHALAEERERCLVSGFDDYLSKPISRTSLVDKLSHLSEATLH